MEIIRLEFQGIGPFTDAHAINFRELGQSGLFLLEGPTGSGKTTILDAVVYALYGDVAGADSSKGRIVSTMLNPRREPFVDLVIDSSRGLLRVRRTPEYERPKLRGEGTTTSKATIKLWKLCSPDDPAGAPISTNVAEASEELQRAIGLTKSQFTQTVMLPQGNFSTFLRAKPEDRRDVLQDIFGTDFYHRFARKLNELAQDHRSKTDRAQSGVFDVASSFCQVAWYDDAVTATVPIHEQVAFDAARDTMDLEALRDGSHRRSTALGEELARARKAAEAARAEHVAAAETLDALETRNQLINEVTALDQRLGKLAGRKEEVEQEEARLAAAERAERARRPLLNVDRATAALDEARQTMRTVVEHLQAGRDADLVAGEPTPDGLRSHEAAARLAAGLLDRVVDLEKGLAERRTAAERERQTQLEERNRIAEGLTQVTKYRDKAIELAGQLAVREEAAARVVSAVEGQAAAAHRRDAAREVVRLTARLAKARETERELAQEHELATQRHQLARDAWLGSLASELASELVDGEPCAVCGSESHPAPAGKHDGFVGRNAVESRAERRDETGRHATEARTRSDQIAGLVEQQAAMTEGLTLAEAEADFAGAKKRREDAEQARQDVAALRNEIDSVTQTALSSERDLRGAEQALAAAIGSLEEKARQLATDQAEVTARAEGFDSVLDLKQTLVARADSARRLSSLLTAAQTARAELNRSSSELNAVLDQFGFSTLDDARSAMLDDPEREQLRGAATAYRDEVAAVEAQLANDRYAGLAGAKPDDVSSARLAEQQADAAQREADDHTGMIRGTVNAVSRASKDLTSKIATFAKLRDEAGPVLRMANLANAGEGNLQRVTLPTYVVLRRFEEVVDLANVRLEAMTGGRYELRRTDEQEGRSRRLGLGLEVVDHQARDTTRDPKTLSGGETFMASLSLALGLADAVTAEAGGIQLHTMFVDEGFGSLDPDTLDAVMQQLSALRDGGRSVGVVSHVAEMKQRIAERVTVVPRRDGTSTLTCSIDA